MKELKEKFNCFQLSSSEIKKLRLALTKKLYSELGYSDFIEYFHNGNRTKYEEKYFSKREALNNVFMLFHNDRHKYADELYNIIWSICNEFTWALPAHTDIKADIDEIVINIDLFSAETAQTLAEIKYLIGDFMPELLQKRVSYEIDRRIIKPFMKKKFGWEKVNNNWAAVCGGCVGMTFIYERPDLMKKISQRFLDIMYEYLNGFGDDGACAEGLDYWIYGFGYFLYFADVYREFTGGQTDLLDDEKVKYIAQFQQNMYLSGNAAISFSDSSRYAYFERGMTDYLKTYYGKEIIPPDNKFSCEKPACSRFAHFIRSYLWRDEYKAYNQDDDFIFYPDAQWYIRKLNSFGFAAKGGNNGESHNHNDIGSFIIAYEGKQIFADIGAGEYTSDYFSENRYKYLCTSSLGHSVPIINGYAQKDGIEYNAEIIKADKDEFCLDISGAYGIEEVRAVIRKFEIMSDTAILTDEFKIEGERCNIIERFISVINPEYINGIVKIGDIGLVCDYKPKITEHIIKNHEGKDEKIFIIDYVIDKCRFKAEIRRI